MFCLDRIHPQRVGVEIFSLTEVPFCMLLGIRVVGPLSFPLGQFGPHEADEV